MAPPEPNAGSPRRLPAARLLLGILGVLLAVRVGFAVLDHRVRNAATANDPVRQAAATPPPPRPTGDFAPAIANPILLQPPSPYRFAEVARASGIDFVHASGMTVERHFPTANGSGVAWIDYDNDGRLDLYFANAMRLPLGTERGNPNRLYRNMGGGVFQDATEASGLGHRGFCHGIIVGDIDNDGDPDVFLCNYGSNALYLNEGGRFRDIGKTAGIDGPGWSSGGAFLDYDNDGDLDLYVTNYGRWSYPEDDRFCTDEDFLYAPGEEKVRIYCSPKSIRPTRHFLYRNNGDLTFTDVTVAAGVGRSDGRGFGVVTADLNGDGRTDIYVANDMCPNFLFLNKGDGTFDDVTEANGAAFDARGSAMSGMGVDADDVDGDGLPELIVTNFERQPNSLYGNLGSGIFHDATARSGMAADSLPWVGWGCGLVDFDNDGWLDVFVTNGHVDNNLHLLGKPSAYAQPPLLHRNIDGRRFALATRGAGPYFDAKHVGRGAAFGDVDNDGDVDIVVNHKDGPPALLRNDTATPNRSIRLALVGTRSNRDAIGARVEVEAGGRVIHRQRKGGASLESSHDPRLTIGVGPVEHADRVTIRWPSGAVSVVDRPATGQLHTIVEPRATP